MDSKKAVLPVVVWIGVGVALGLATGNLAVWIALGTMFGLLMAYVLSRRSGGPTA